MKTWKRWAILFIGLIENLVFSGSILGWSALNYMLKQEGIFHSLCELDASGNAITIANTTISSPNVPYSNQTTLTPSSTFSDEDVLVLDMDLNRISHLMMSLNSS